MPRNGLLSLETLSPSLTASVKCSRIKPVLPSHQRDFSKKYILICPPPPPLSPPTDLICSLLVLSKKQSAETKRNKKSHCFTPQVQSVSCSAFFPTVCFFFPSHQGYIFSFKIISPHPYPENHFLTPKLRSLVPEKGS